MVNILSLYYLLELYIYIISILDFLYVNFKDKYNYVIDNISINVFGNNKMIVLA